MSLLPQDPNRRRPSLTNRGEIREFARYLAPGRRAIWIVYQQVDNRGGSSEVFTRLERMPLRHRIELIRHIAESMHWSMKGSLEDGELVLESPLHAEMREIRQREAPSEGPDLLGNG